MSNHIVRATFYNKKKQMLHMFVVAELGIKDLLPAFRSPFLKTSELSTGVCFASGGSGLDKFTASIQVNTC